jgi:flavorubredoxin
MPFEPLPLLILIDDTQGRCAKVVPQMKALLEHRGFVVDVHRIQDGPVDVTPYRGIVLGAPTFGVGLKDLPPTEALADYLDAIDDIDEKSIAVFTVFRVWPGNSLERMKGLVLRLGAQFVAWHGYSLSRPEKGEHIIPAECMVRIR